MNTTVSSRDARESNPGPQAQKVNSLPTVLPRWRQQGCNSFCSLNYNYRRFITFYMKYSIFFFEYQRKAFLIPFAQLNTFICNISTSLVGFEALLSNHNKFTTCHSITVFVSKKINFTISKKNPKSILPAIKTILKFRFSFY